MVIKVDANDDGSRNSSSFDDAEDSMDKKPGPPGLLRQESFVDEDAFRYVHVRNNDFNPLKHGICDSCQPLDTDFASNQTQTAKYTLFTFLPIFLFEQFRKKANFYFLLIGLFSFTDLSPESPLIGFSPIMFVLIVSGVKEIWEDYRRHKQDEDVNNYEVLAFRNRVATVPTSEQSSSRFRSHMRGLYTRMRGVCASVFRGGKDPKQEILVTKENEWVSLKWKDLRVGDLVMLKEGSDCPADLVLLTTSRPQGECNVETANLDGETNLKIKQGIPPIFDLPCHDDGLDFPNVFSGVLQSDAPSVRMDSSSWKGTFTLSNHVHSSSVARPLPLNMSQLLLRGSTLRNTEWAVCLVAFTGADTKVVLNNRISVFKRSKVDRLIDKVLYAIFTLQFIFCTSFALTNGFWIGDNRETWYLLLEDESAVQASAESWVTFLVLLNLLVPISLYVTMELIKFTQAWFISQDVEMYHAEKDMPAQARTSNLNEELGQVSFMFVDKTGTLTQNQMEFLRCSIAGKAYGDVADNKKKIGDLPEGVPESPIQFRDSRLVSTLQANGEDAQQIDEFLTLLAVCHTVVPQFHDEHLFVAQPKKKKKKKGRRGTGRFLKAVSKVPHQLRSFSVDRRKLREEKRRRKAAEVTRDGSAKEGLGGTSKGETLDRKLAAGDIRIDGRPSSKSTDSPPASALKTVSDSSSSNLDDIASSSESARTSISSWERGAGDSPSPFDSKTKVNGHRVEAEAGAPMDSKQSTASNGHSPAGKVDPLAEDDGRPKAATYRASSPDENALVLGALSNRYYFHNRTSAMLELNGRKEEGQLLSVNIRGEEVVFELFAALEFTSSRKRMSVVVRDPRDNKIKIYMKGADNVIFDRLTTEAMESDARIACEKHIDAFAEEGLRTLVMASREIDPDDLSAWLEKRRQAESSMVDRENAIGKCDAMLEHDFELLGSTAIEDKLQDGVPETIEKISRTGIRIWLLTGDKVQTAINVARSARLITHEMSQCGIIVIEVDDRLSTSDARKETALALNNAWDLVRNDEPADRESRAFVINGKALDFIFPDEDHESFDPKTQMAAVKETQRFLLSIMSQCQAVLCCRVSPKHKADLVRLVRDNVKDTITLAIGDGANDVPMIKAAHVGIGISGNEGVQAVSASDYAIGQFRFLQRLLLVHGAQAYSRICVLILYSFYKNFVVSFGHIYFAFYSAYSAQDLYDPTQASLWNTIFTALPVLLAALFNRDYSTTAALRYPKLYRRGLTGELFTLRKFFVWLITGVVHATFIFYLTTDVFGVTHRGDGQDPTQRFDATVMFTVALFLVTAVMGLLTTTWHWIHYIGIFGSPLVFLLFFYVQCISPEDTPLMFDIFQRLATDALFWGALGLVLFGVLSIHIGFEAYKHIYNPTALDIINEIEFKLKGELPPVSAGNESLKDGQAPSSAAHAIEMVPSSGERPPVTKFTQWHDERSHSAAAAGGGGQLLNSPTNSEHRRQDSLRSDRKDAEERSATRLHANTEPSFGTLAAQERKLAVLASGVTPAHSRHSTGMMGVGGGVTYYKDSSLGGGFSRAPSLTIRTGVSGFTDFQADNDGRVRTGVMPCDVRGYPSAEPDEDLPRRHHSFTGIQGIFMHRVTPSVSATRPANSAELYLATHQGRDPQRNFLSSRFLRKEKKSKATYDSSPLESRSMDVRRSVHERPSDFHLDDLRTGPPPRDRRSPGPETYSDSENA